MLILFSLPICIVRFIHIFSPLYTTYTFILIVNIDFWNYYAPSRAYARKPPFNHLDSTSSELTFPCILAHNRQLYFHFLREGQQGERRADPMSTLHSPTWPPHIYLSSPNIPLIYFRGKLHAAPRHFCCRSPRNSGAR